jgi:hypothetical protein
VTDKTPSPRPETFDKMLTALAFVESVINRKPEDTQALIGTMNSEDMTAGLVFALTQTVIDNANNSGRTVQEVLDSLRQVCITQLGKSDGA